MKFEAVRQKMKAETAHRKDKKEKAGPKHAKFGEKSEKYAKMA